MSSKQFQQWLFQRIRDDLGQTQYFCLTGEKRRCQEIRVQLQENQNRKPQTGQLHICKTSMEKFRCVFFSLSLSVSLSLSYTHTHTHTQRDSTRNPQNNKYLLALVTLYLNVDTQLTCQKHTSYARKPGSGHWKVCNVNRPTFKLQL